METVKNLVDKYYSVMQDVVLRLEELTEGKGRIELDQMFIDDSDNLITGIDQENVYGQDKFFYSIHELSFWDAIKLIETIEKFNQ